MNAIQKFRCDVQRRDRAGLRQYGNRSFDLSVARLCNEVLDELTDTWNWSAILLTKRELTIRQRGIIHAVRLSAAVLHMVLQQAKPKGCNMKMKERFKPGDFVIVNDLDRPTSRLIARVVTVEDDSIAAEYCYDPEYGVMDGLTNATLVSDFGQDVEVVDGHPVVRPNGKPSVAKYRSVEPRHWQEVAP